MTQYLITGLAVLAAILAALRIWRSSVVATPQGAETAYETEAAEPAQDKAPNRFALNLGGSRKLLLGAGALLAIAAAGAMLRGDPSAPNDPASTALPGAMSGDKAAGLDDVQTMISRLAERLEKNPNDGEGFRMLGWSYVMTGQPEQAIAPYKQALRLLPGNPQVLSGYGEAVVGVAKGAVTNEARSLFAKALKLDPTEPRARHFEALWLAQNGKEGQALEQWIALANSGPADAPWQADVLRQIDETARKLGSDVSARLKVAPVQGAAGGMPPIDPQAMQAANAMPAGDRQAMIDGMVEGLAAKLRQDPKNPEGWAKLLRSRMVLGQQEQARSDLATARKALAANKAGLAKVEAIAREAGVPGA